MFQFQRPIAAVLAGLATSLVGVFLNTAFAMAWTSQLTSGGF